MTMSGMSSPAAMYWETLFAETGREVRLEARRAACSEERYVVGCVGPEGVRLAVFMVRAILHVLVGVW